MTKLLGFNVDHIATLRNARGGTFPCPVHVAKLAADCEADLITAHLREDRRHIKDEDIFRIKKEVDLPLNFECAPTDEMVQIALKLKPYAVCIVPEKRQELTTEGGLDVVAHSAYLRGFIGRLKDKGIRVSLFIDPNLLQTEEAKKIGADVVEFHTGAYANTEGDLQEEELEKIIGGAFFADSIGLECHAGHGLNYENVENIAAIPEIRELHIGHFLVGVSLYIGLETAIKTMKKTIDIYS